MRTFQQGEPAHDTATDGTVGSHVPPRSTAELYSDLPIRRSAEDRLEYNAYAEALAELIDSPSVATPLTLSINAPWGAGKTSLARLIERKAREWPEERGDPPHIVCWFNAWMHSDAPSLGPALAAAVAKTVARERSTWRRIARPLSAAMLSPEERRRRRVLVLCHRPTGMRWRRCSRAHKHGPAGTNRPPRPGPAERRARDRREPG